VVDRGSIVSTTLLEPGASSKVLTTIGWDVAATELLPTVFEHERAPFPSFPYEWSDEMLHAAALLTLDLAEATLGDGFCLKDATPYNVLFWGPSPRFVDILSFEKRHPNDPTWLPYGQFVRTFLLPLVISKYFGISIRQVFLSHRDGLEPEEVYRLCGPVRRLLPPFLTLATVPTWLGKRRRGYDPAVYRAKLVRDPSHAQYVLEHLLRSLRRNVEAAGPAISRRSSWAEYAVTEAAESFDAKRAFVEGVLKEFRPKSVLDVGCNTGYHAALAARLGARVVAIDRDPVAVGRARRTPTSDRLDILPLAVILTNPSPSLGLLDAENPSLLERARGRFQVVLMLAVIHHMIAAERIPLPSIVALAAELATELAVIEFVTPDDTLFRRLARGRDDLYRGLTIE